MRHFAIAGLVAAYGLAAPAMAATWDTVIDDPAAALYTRRISSDHLKTIHYVEAVSVPKPKRLEGAGFTVRRTYVSCADEQSEAVSVSEYSALGQLVGETKFKSYDPAHGVPHQWRTAAGMGDETITIWRWACGRVKAHASLGASTSAEVASAVWRADAPTAAAEQKWGIPRRFWAVAGDGDLWRSAAQRPQRVELARLVAGAEAGDATAQTLLGIAFEHGLGGAAKNDATAASWYARAAASGSLRGRHNLAFMLMNGRGVAQDMPRAVALYRAGADAQFQVSAYSLGVALVKGTGAPSDPAAGAKRIAFAASAGMPDAQGYLASLYEQGLGVTQDKPEAARLYARAYGGLGKDDLLQKLSATAPADAPGMAQVYRTLRRYGAVSGECRSALDGDLALRVSQQALAYVDALPQPARDHASIIFEAAAKRARLFATPAVPSANACEAAYTQLSGAFGEIAKPRGSP